MKEGGRYYKAGGTFRPSIDSVILEIELKSQPCVLEKFRRQLIPFGLLSRVESYLVLLARC